MSLINFPSSPSLYQTYTVGTKTWIWNGYAWDLQSANTSFIFNQANSAFTEANSAYSLAQSAFNTANAAYTEANSAYTLANSAYSLANTPPSELVNGTFVATLDNGGNLIVPGTVFANGLETYGQLLMPSNGVGTGIVTTNGLGNIYFNTDNSLNFIIDGTYQHVFNADGTIIFGGGYIFPNTKGNTNQVLVFDGGQNLYWQDQTDTWARSEVNSAFTEANSAITLAQYAYNKANLSASGNPFDQGLNTTDNVTFNELTVTANAAIANLQINGGFGGPFSNPSDIVINGNILSGNLSITQVPANQFELHGVTFGANGIYGYGAGLFDNGLVLSGYYNTFNTQLGTNNYNADVAIISDIGNLTLASNTNNVYIISNATAPTTYGPYSIVDGNNYTDHHELYIAVSNNPTLGSEVGIGDLIGDGNLPPTPIIAPLTNDGTNWTVKFSAQAPAYQGSLIFFGGRKTWNFDSNGVIHLPLNGDIQYQNGVSALGGSSFNQSLNTTDNVTFYSVDVTSNATVANISFISVAPPWDAQYPDSNTVDSYIQSNFTTGNLVITAVPANQFRLYGQVEAEWPWGYPVTMFDDGLIFAGYGNQINTQLGTNNFNTDMAIVSQYGNLSLASNTNNVYIISNGWSNNASPINSTWNFDANGIIHLPIGGDVYNSNGVSVLGGSLTVSEVNANGSTSNVVSTVNTIEFDTDSGFDVQNLGGGVVKVGMNSTFKYWEVDGVQALTANGIDTVNFIGANGISISASNTTTPQSITFDASPIITKINAIEANTSGIYTSNTVTDTTTILLLDSFPIGEYRTGKYLVQASNDTDVQSLEVMVNHNDVNAFTNITTNFYTSSNPIIAISSKVDTANGILNVYVVPYGLLLDLPGPDGDLEDESGSEDLMSDTTSTFDLQTAPPEFLVQFNNTNEYVNAVYNYQNVIEDLMNENGHDDLLVDLGMEDFSTELAIKLIGELTNVDFTRMSLVARPLSSGVSGDLNLQSGLFDVNVGTGVIDENA